MCLFMNKNTAALIGLLIKNRKKIQNVGKLLNDGERFVEEGKKIFNQGKNLAREIGDHELFRQAKDWVADNISKNDSHKQGDEGEFKGKAEAVDVEHHTVLETEIDSDHISYLLDISHIIDDLKLGLDLSKYKVKRNNDYLIYQIESDSIEDGHDDLSNKIILRRFLGVPFLRCVVDLNLNDDGHVLLNCTITNTEESADLINVSENIIFKDNNKLDLWIIELYQPIRKSNQVMLKITLK